MNKTLQQIFNKSIQLLRQDDRCLGGWHFGSIMRGNSDEFSDVDPVFLVNDEDFNSFDADIPRLFQKIGAKCLMIWPEEFNSGNLKNYAVLIEDEEDNVLQYDITFLNKSKVYKSLSKIFYQGCNESHIIFDKTGEVKELLQDKQEEKSMQVDVLHQVEKYWLFCFMMVKYYKRNNKFKMLNGMQELFQTHTNLLLSVYGKAFWGDLPSIIKNNIPEEKQEYLLHYFCEAELENIKKHLFLVMEYFSEDARMVCEKSGLEYEKKTEQSIRDYMERNME